MFEKGTLTNAHTVLAPMLVITKFNLYGRGVHVPFRTQVCTVW